MSKEQELMEIVNDPFRHRDDWDNAVNMLAFLASEEAIQCLKAVERDRDNRPGWLRNSARKHLIALNRYLK
ncbi:MAG: hypothetical protein HN929_10070 [Chloroflexi bacterium]|jgi:hypothetical protein|nr:hypothetical protein [Chloroflexota bacterium]MBT7081796.1 hypothetical protein [Chloroflexota bacterium]MBT7289050.1 hypothetical protein [Chloroflexota bacterium]